MLLSCVSLVVLLVSATQAVHECVHHTIDQPTAKATNIPYKNHPYDKSLSHQERRRLAGADSTYDYIRITPYWDELEATLSGSDLTWIKSLVSAAIRHIESFTKVVPVDGTLYLPRRCESWVTVFGYIQNCLSFTNVCSQATMPDEHFERSYLYSSASSSTTVTILPQGNGIEDTDLVLYFTYGSTGCGSSTLAYATACVQDQYGRPLAGAINFCPNVLSTQRWKEDVVTTLHEIMHTMAMSTGLFDDFVDSNGDPLAFSDVYYETTLPNGNDQGYIITDRVKARAQDHFNCYDDATLPGLPLEDDGGSQTASSHWEEQHVNTEFMGGRIYSSLTYVSEFTLAIMEDSGWYKVDYNYSEPFFWGHAEGCSFFTDDCVNKNTEISNYQQYFCHASSDDGCQYDYAAPGNCLMYNYLEDLPIEFQYYSDATLGGTDLSQFCSFRDPTTYSVSGELWEEVCFDTPPAGWFNPYSGITHGLTSRCVDTKTGGGVEKGYCFEHQCYGYNSGTGAWSGVNIVMSGSETITCTAGEKLMQKSSSSTGLTITCPDVEAICRSSSPFACKFGNFNDELGQCVCSAGYIGATCDTEDSSVVSGVVLGPVVVTPAPTTPQNNLCMKNVPSLTTFFESWNTDDWAYDGILNTMPSYFLSSSAVYLYYHWYYHAWYIGPTKGGTAYYAYCHAYEGAFEEDIAECHGDWIVYNYLVQQNEAYPDIRAYFGTCDSSPAPTAITSSPTMSAGPLPTPAPTSDPTPAPTSDPTPAPTSDPTPSPTDTTPAPTDPTPSPTDTTPAPTDPTPSPTDTTPSPTNGPTRAPTPAPSLATLQPTGGGGGGSAAWSQLPALSIEVTQFGAATVNGVYHLWGGSTDTTSSQSAHFSFDPVTNMWTQLTNAKWLARGSRQAPVAYNGMIYTYGGPRSTRIMRFNPSTDTWNARRILNIDGVAAKLDAPSGGITDGGDDKYCVAGGVLNNVINDRTFCYDISANSWTEFGAMPDGGRHSAAGVGYNGLLYIFGGKDGSQQINVPGPVRTDAYVFDPVANVWNTLPSMPEGVAGTGQAVEVSGKLIVMGGEGWQDCCDVAYVSSRVMAFDVAENAWYDLDSMLTPRQGIYPVAIGNVVYVAGGGEGLSSATDGSARGSVFEALDVDLATFQLVESPAELVSEWATATTLPLALSQHACVALDGVYYLWGGDQSLMYRFDAGTNLWTQLSNARSTSRGSRVVAAAYNQFIFTFGGSQTDRMWRYNPNKQSWWARAHFDLDGVAKQLDAPSGGMIGSQFFIAGGVLDGATSSRTFYYSISSNSWFEVAAMPGGGRFSSSSIAYNGLLYVFGGKTGSQQVNVPSPGMMDAYAYDPVGDVWNTLASLPQGVAGGAQAVELLGKLIVIGGEDCCDTSDAVMAYDVAQDAWEYLDPMLSARQGPCAVNLNGVIYVSGGGTGVSSGVEGNLQSSTHETLSLSYV